MATLNNWTFIDYSNEKSSVGVVSQDLTAGNFATEATEANALRDAILGLSTGTLHRSQRSIVVLGTSTPPTDPFSQRELKWLITYVGITNGKQFQIEIPTADLTGQLVPGTDLALVTSAEWLAFETAFEDFARSPENGTELVQFTGARLVGRNI